METEKKYISELFQRAEICSQIKKLAILLFPEQLKIDSSARALWPIVNSFLNGAECSSGAGEGAVSSLAQRRNSSASKSQPRNSQLITIQQREENNFVKSFYEMKKSMNSRAQLDGTRSSLTQADLRAVVR